MPFEELTKKQSLMWDSAPFENLSDGLVPIYDDLITRLGVHPGEKWLDLATGTGAIALRVAQLGVTVTAQDFAPSLIETAKKLAQDQGITNVLFEIGDCQKLSYSDGSFDVVSSAQGMIFAPDHQAVAKEISRVCKPGGRIGFTSWRAGGNVEKFLNLMARFSPLPPNGAGSSLAWGNPDYIKQMFDKSFTLEFYEGNCPQYGKSPEALRDLFLTSFGPAKILYDGFDKSKREELKDALTNYFRDFLQDDGSVLEPREYLVVVGISK